MNHLKSVGLVAAGVLSVAAFMATVFLCPFAFLRFSRREEANGEQSTPDVRLQTNSNSWEARITRTSGIYASI